MRIVSLSPSATDVLIRLGLVDEIKAVSAFCPAYVGEVKGKPIAGDYMSVKRVLLKKLRPDFVVITSGIQRQIKETLKGLGIRILEYPVPVTLGGLLENVLKLGILVGRSREALKLYQELKDDLMRIANLRAWRGLKAYVEIWVSDRVMTGLTSYVSDVIRTLGAVNINDDLVDPFPPLDREKVIREDPDLVIINSDFEPVDMNRLIEERNWESIKAVKNRRIMVLGVERSLSHYGPKLIETIDFLARAFKE
ncbi:hypothetical protein DRN86_02730 [Candidatus Geothermarchaeota archaeon]|mgnify:CR=1 FL=1|nr:MAG: hypothetical protein DRN86_02730 [Candidatus Geothermarchaeota archaeon]